MIADGGGKTLEVQNYVVLLLPKHLDGYKKPGTHASIQTWSRLERNYSVAILRQRMNASYSKPFWL